MLPSNKPHSLYRQDAELCATSRYLNTALKLVGGKPDMEANHGRR